MCAGLGFRVGLFASFQFGPFTPRACPGSRLLVQGKRQLLYLVTDTGISNVPTLPDRTSQTPAIMCFRLQSLVLLKLHGVSFLFGLIYLTAFCLNLGELARPADVFSQANRCSPGIWRWQSEINHALSSNMCSFERSKRA